MNNSVDSNCNDLFSSSPSTHPSLNYKPIDEPSSPEPSPSVCSLPLLPAPKPRALIRRRSSANFEARMERVELMMKPESQPRPIPDDLLKLQELKTVRASPFRDMSSSSDNSTDLLKQKSNGVLEKHSFERKCLDIVPQFEEANNSEDITSSTNTDNDVQVPLKSSFRRDILMWENESRKQFSCELKPFDFCHEVPSSGGGDHYNFPAPPPVQSDVPLIPLPAPLSPGKSESEDSQSLDKECEVTSSATLELDIKLVANASSNLKKFKMKASRQRNGSQNDILKKEIFDQERGLKNQIATLEKKAHENWVAARQAERRLDESKQEAGQLRNMLTLMEKCSAVDGAPTSAPRVHGELNGDELPMPLLPLLPDGTSPIPLPPLPLDPLAGHPPMLPPNFMPPFMPPPLLPPPPHMTGDRRLPPLGRMSSPPLNRFSPAPGDYEYDRISPSLHYRSPPPHHRSSPWDDPPQRSGFRPVASHRNSRRDYQGSNQSSGHSSEDSLDKHHSTRRGKV